MISEHTLIAGYQNETKVMTTDIEYISMVDMVGRGH